LADECDPLIRHFVKMCGFFLWIILKHNVYSNNPRTEDELRHSMQDFTSSSTYN